MNVYTKCEHKETHRCRNCGGQECTRCGACRCGGEPPDGGWLYPEDGTLESDVLPDLGDR